MPLELRLVAWSVVLLVVHLAAQGATANAERGLRFNAGPRDGTPPPLGPLAGRAERALRNYLETWPAFLALALALAITGRTGGTATTGAAIWVGARIVYLPLYLAGVPWVRSLAWGIAALGLALMTAPLL